MTDSQIQEAAEKIAATLNVDGCSLNLALRRVEYASKLAVSYHYGRTLDLRDNAVCGSMSLRVQKILGL